MDTKNNANIYEQALILEEQRQTFVASLGHDLKNPTIAQIRALELLLKGAFGEIKPVQKEILKMILDSGKYMYAMLGSFLITYKNDNGAIKLDNKEISIYKLADECVNEMIYLAKDKDLNVNISNLSQNDIVYGDKIQIKRVIMNLLSNGIKYAYTNSELNINVFNKKNCVCFSCENNSPYIPREKQNSIFEKYISYAQNYSTNGIGLGLYASKRIIEAHNGKISVKSTKDNHNTFYFMIPCDAKYKEIERFVVF